VPNMINPKNSRGDTIVEVMICIAIIGAVMGGAFSIVNRSTQRIREAQERSEAVARASDQAERLKALYAADKQLICTDTGSPVPLAMGDFSPFIVKDDLTLDCSLSLPGDCNTTGDIDYTGITWDPDPTNPIVVANERRQFVIGAGFCKFDDAGGSIFNAVLFIYRAEI
jgi:type II secretory pathway pseudopilin PulG